MKKVCSIFGGGFRVFRDINHVFFFTTCFSPLSHGTKSLPSEKILMVFNCDFSTSTLYTIDYYLSL